MSTARTNSKTLIGVAGAGLFALLTLGSVLAAPLAIKDSPLFLNQSSAPLNMLVLSRDHRLYYEAYNDASDLNSDGILDVGYKPAEIDYFGYFESKQCYSYSGGIFVPGGAAGTDKTCSGSAEWSGDWLNYMTTSRIDALRKVLYGGTRYIDTASDTVLQRAYIPQDAHSWGKEYESIAASGYDIRLYTPLNLPNANTRHLFANTSVASDANETGLANTALNGIPVPKFRVVQNRNNRIWDWVSKERPVAHTSISGADTSAPAITDYIVRVRVCTSGSYDVADSNNNCKLYSSGNAKPSGLLQDYGENNAMYFGLLSGSYGKPHDGGVLRKAMASITTEMNAANGTFIYNQNPPGVISTIDRMRVTSFDRGGGYSYGCGWITTSSDSGATCSMWGNPTAEMMYEALRYFGGKTGPTSNFYSGANSAEETELGLVRATWDSNTNPYRASGGFPNCAKPFQTVISDISPSYDSDSLPGSSFNSFSGDLSGMNVATLGSTIWNNDIGGSGSYFIGQSGITYDGAPTVKTVSSFGNIRGLAPEAPAKEGSYYAGSVAYYGNINDLSTASGKQKVQTFAVALASPLPKIEIPVNGHKITLVPFAKSVGGDGWGITPGQGSYQPTNQIVDFYVDHIDATSGRFRVNFEDVEQGADHDMDAIVVYNYIVNADGTVTVSLTSEYAAGSIIQHMGYVISGTTADDSYLVVRDLDTAAGSDPDFYLDKPNVAGALPLSDTRTFTPGATAGASFLKDPLWYAAKWGGFQDTNNNNLPDQRSEWAQNAADTDTDPDPDNYFLVTSALTLRAQLARAFNDILDRSGSSSSASVSSGSISDDTRVYQATFDSRFWAGHLTAYTVGTGSGGTTEGALGASVWDASNQMPAPASRKILTVLPTPAASTTGIMRSGVAFRWASIGATRQTQLQPSDSLGSSRLDYLRGVRTSEQPSGAFRRRTAALGDIVNSEPVFVGAPPWRYSDSLESVAYSSFAIANASRQKVVYTGANDGMMHAFDAVTGVELFAYVPHGVFKNLVKLTDPAYSHLFYTDGTPSIVDAFYSSAWHTVLVAGLNKGGQSVYALDVTNPTAITEGTASSTVLWEFTDLQDKDLGYTYSRPAVVKMQNGVWAAVFGNGYNNTENTGGEAAASISTTGNAALYVVNIQTGALISKITVPVGTAQDPLASGRPNGLATPAVVDANGDGRADTVYAGDLFGNLWKFNLSSSDPTAWSIAFTVSSVPAPLFVATDASGNRQPITERPQVGRGPNGQGWVVLFGTGKFMESNDRVVDLASPKPQAFYGVFDRATGAVTDIVPRSGLLQQTVLQDTTYTYTDASGTTTTVPVRLTSNNLRTAAHRGWYINLVSVPFGYQGEMQVTNPVLRNGRIIFTSLIPDADVCAYGGRSWLMDMDALSGSRLTYSPFDLNRDSEYNSTDYVLLGGVLVPASGRGADSILTTPAFLAGSLGDYALTSSSGSSTDDSTIGVEGSNSGPSGRGRQSWRQLR